MEHHNWDYNGLATPYPEYVGDRYSGQDRVRDFWYLLNELGKNIKECYEDFPILLANASVTEGSSYEEIDISAIDGIANYEVDLPDDWTSIPPTTKQEDIIVMVGMTAQTDLDISGTATLNGSSTNYVKLRYNEADGSSRTRARGSGGSYVFEKESSFTIVVDTVAPTDYDVVLATIIGDGSTYMTIVNYNKTLMNGQLDPYTLLTEDTTLIPNKKYKVTEGLELSLPDSADEGCAINIFSEGVNTILQTDAEHVISHLNKYFTTKGVLGFLKLGYKNSCELVYKGSGVSRIEPGVKLTDPSSLPAGNGSSCDFSYDGVYLAVAHATSPYITIYKRSGDTFSKLTDPSSLPTGSGNGCSFSHDGNYLAVAHATSPYITIYKRSGDTFTKLTNPSSLPTGIGYDCDFSYDGNYLAVVHNSSPYVTIYSRSGDTFSKLTDPSSLPAGFVYGCSFSPDGNYLAVAHVSSPYITIYSISSDTFTKLTDPSSLPAGGSNGCSFSHDGNYLAVAHATSPYITIYKRFGDTFSKLTDPSSLPAGFVYGCSFSPDGVYLADAHVTSPYITIYKRSSDTFSKLTDPSSLPTGDSTECCFSPDGVFLAVAHNTSPYITIYKNVESADKQWYIKELTVLNDIDKEYMFE